MSKFPTLTKPPILEAIIEFRFPPIGIENQESILNCASSFKESFPIEEIGQSTQVEFKLAPGSPPPTINRGAKLIVLRSEDRKRALTFATDRVAASLVNEYSGWDSLLKQAMSLWDETMPKIECRQITRIGVRFINQLQIPEKQIDFDDYLKIGPKLPKKVPQVVSEFAHKTVMVNEEMQLLGQLLVGYTLIKPNIITLDIDVSTYEAVETKREIVVEKLNKARHYKNEIFFNSLTKKTLELLK